MLTVALVVVVPVLALTLVRRAAGHPAVRFLLDLLSSALVLARLLYRVARFVYRLVAGGGALVDAVALLTLGTPVLGVSSVLTVSTVRYARADSLERVVLRKCWRIRATWRRTALRCGLYQADQAAPAGGQTSMMSSRDRLLIPRITVTPARNGVTVLAKTVGQVGLREFERAADDLANAWQVRYVTVSNGKPGYVKLRITLRDGLRQRSVLAVSPDTPVDLRSWEIGHDREMEPVAVRTSDVSGIVAAGLSGFGKTVLVRQRFTRLAPSPAVQFALIDGQDYQLEDLAPRAWLHCGDSINDAYRVLDSRAHVDGRASAQHPQRAGP